MFIVNECIEHANNKQKKLVQVTFTMHCNLKTAPPPRRHASRSGLQLYEIQWA